MNVIDKAVKSQLEKLAAMSEPELDANRTRLNLLIESVLRDMGPLDFVAPPVMHVLAITMRDQGMPKPLFLECIKEITDAVWSMPKPVVPFNKLRIDICEPCRTKVRAEMKARGTPMTAKGTQGTDAAAFLALLTQVVCDKCMSTMKGMHT